jgi:hypothetical protein
MELILDVPRLANHPDKSGGRPDETGNVDALVTRDGRIAVGHTNGFDDNHRLEAWPFC